MVLATQRPSVDVLTGLIKSNMPTRISFQVASRVESGIILGQGGAEKLIGQGDMLYMPAGISTPVRAKGVLVTDEEIGGVLGHLRSRSFSAAEEAVNMAGDAAPPPDAPAAPPVSADELYEQAVRVVLSEQRGSGSLLQRRLQVGYTRAGKLIDMMFVDGIVGPPNGSKPRAILMTLDQWEASRGRSGLRKSA